MSKVSFALIGLLVLSAITIVVVRNRRRVAEPWYYDQLQQVSFQVVDNDEDAEGVSQETTLPQVVSPLALPDVEPTVENPSEPNDALKPAFNPLGSPSLNGPLSPQETTPTPNEVPPKSLPLPSPLGPADEGPIGSGVAPSETPNNSEPLNSLPKPLRLPPPDDESTQSFLPWENENSTLSPKESVAENDSLNAPNEAALSRLPATEEDSLAKDSPEEFAANDFPSDIAPQQGGGGFSGQDDLQVADDDGKKKNAIRRLPPADGILNDVISFAAGAVEVSLPNGWEVFETTSRREVRLVLTKPKPKPKSKSDEKSETKPKGLRGLPTDGVWISYHLSQEPAHRRTEEINEMFARRFKLATGIKSTSTEVYDLKIDGEAALAEEFEITKKEEKLQGLHMLVATQWGICEIHASTPAENYAENEAALTSLIESISFNRPNMPSSVFNGSTASAESIHGVWKSLRSRMRIMADGRIEVEADQSHPLNVGTYDEDGERDIVKGTYTASGDLLRVVWEDESKLNFRWKRKGLSLLMTDHEGKISHLKLILE